MAQRNRAYSRGGLQVTHPDAAGVDVGGATHYAAVHPDATDEPVRQFNCFTGELHAAREHLFKICGVDLTRIDGIDVTTAMTVISEVGCDMSRFASVKHFTSWLGLCPGTKISGGKVLGAATSAASTGQRRR